MKRYASDPICGQVTPGHLLLSYQEPGAQIESPWDHRLAKSLINGLKFLKGLERSLKRKRARQAWTQASAFQASSASRQPATLGLLPSSKLDLHVRPWEIGLSSRRAVLVRETAENGPFRSSGQAMRPSSWHNSEAKRSSTCNAAPFAAEEAESASPRPSVMRTGSLASSLAVRPS